MNSLNSLLATLSQTRLMRLSDFTKHLTTDAYEPRPVLDDNFKPYEMKPLNEVSSAGITRLVFEFGFDVHHQNPRETEDPIVASLTLHLRDDETSQNVAAFFEAEPRALETRVDDQDVYELDSVFFRKHSLEVFISRARPGWARISWDQRAIEQLTDRIVACIRDPVDANFSRLGATLQRPEAQSAPRRSRDQRLELSYDLASSPSSPAWVIHFATPFPAADLMRKLDKNQLILFSRDFHMSRSLLAEIETRTFEIGRWTLDFSIEESGAPDESRSARRAQNTSVSPLPLDMIFLTNLNGYLSR